MWSPDVPAFVPLYCAALLALFTRGWLRVAIMLAAPILGGLHLLGIEPGVSVQLQLLTFDLEPYRVDRLSLLFGYLFHIAALIGVIYALHVKDTMQHVAALLYAGSAVGAVFAGDLVTLFMFWEAMGLSSAFLIWASRDERSVGTGIRYLMFQVVSGLLLLVGLMWHAQATGSIAFNQIGTESTAGWLILLAFGVKAGFPFLHNWLTDGYPASTPTGTVFLCMFTTKAAVYALARGFPGTEALIYVGMTMACFPIFFAVIENDLRRVLAYSMINQLGFMVVGVGIGTALALNGAVAHAFNDVLFKGLLMMAMGAVLLMTGRMNGSDLGGLYKSMPITATLCCIGAASISAFPLFNGFVSKSMVMSALMYEGYEYVWLAMLFASAGVFHHAGIKIPYFAFFAHDSGIRTTEPPVNMLIAMGIAAVACIAIGSFPSLLYNLLPYDYEYSPYDMTHVLTQLQLLFFSALAFVWLNMRGMYPPELRSTNIDIEWLWRKGLPRLGRGVVAACRAVSGSLGTAGSAMLKQPIFKATRNNLQMALARNWPTGSMVMWVGVFLAVMLVAGILSTRLS